MNGRDWYERFVAAGPHYAAQRYSVSETQSLLLKAGVGAGLPLGHAQDLSVLAAPLMSDARLVAMAAAALDGPHLPTRIEGTDEHLVLEQPSVLMAGPLLVDHLISGAKRVVVRDADWPLLLWPMLSQAEQVYGVAFTVDAGARGTATVTMTDISGLDPFGPVQPLPIAVAERLSTFAARTYVPASDASRATGAGAGLNDND